jgi:hypothetical protein
MVEFLMILLRELPWAAEEAEVVVGAVGESVEESGRRLAYWEFLHRKRRQA